MTVAALYVERGGVYWNLPGVDPWDEERDARNYAGPWPVVAHPPCARWSRLAPLHGRLGEDGGTFASALDAVRRCGGVLEHPAHSYAWRRYGLPRPVRGGWTTSLLDGGCATEVDQYAYGFPLGKPTWLYAFGVAPQGLDWGTTGKSGVCSSFSGGWPSQRGQRSATPTAFRDVLLAMARSALPSGCGALQAASAGSDAAAR